MESQWEQFDEASIPNTDNVGYLVPVGVPQGSAKYGKNLLQLLWGVLGSQVGTD